MDYTLDNWKIISHVFSGFVSCVAGRLQNINLNPTLFSALEHAAKNKLICENGRPRNDDSLVKAIGNWLYSKEFGAWRNPDSTYKYKWNNKQIWASFVHSATDYSYSAATGHKKKTL